jgi:hypothetical protein
MTGRRATAQQWWSLTSTRISSASRRTKAALNAFESTFGGLIAGRKYKPRSSYTVKLTDPLLRDPAAVRVGRNGTMGGS